MLADIWKTGGAERRESPGRNCVNWGVEEGNQGLCLSDFIPLYWSALIIQRNEGGKLERCFRNRFWITVKTRMRN